MKQKVINKKTLLFLAVGLSVLMIIGSIILYRPSQGSKNDKYYTDPISGELFFNDPNQTPEKFGKGLVTLIGSEKVSAVLSSKQVAEFRQKLTSWSQDKTDEEITNTYILKDSFKQIDKSNISFRIKTAPHNLESDVKIGYVGVSVIYVWFDNEGPYIKETRNTTESDYYD